MPPHGDGSERAARLPDLLRVLLIEHQPTADLDLGGRAHELPERRRGPLVAWARSLRPIASAGKSAGDHAQDWAP